MLANVAQTCCLLLALLTPNSESEKALWNASREGDLEEVKRLLDDGVDVNAATPYGATALAYASARGHLEVVQLLCERGADPSAKDTFYQATPLAWAMMESNDEIIRTLLEYGADGVDDALITSVAMANEELVKLLLETERVSNEAVAVSQMMAEAGSGESLKALLAAVEIPEEERPARLESETLTPYVGTYSGSGVRYDVIAGQGFLYLVLPSRQRLTCVSRGDDRFGYLDTTVEFEIEGEQATTMVVVSEAGERRLSRIEAAEVEQANIRVRPPRPLYLSEGATAEDLRVSGPNWPSFRGTGARGVAEGQQAPRAWDATHGVNQAWATDIPGLGLSCPVVWGDKVFVTSAVSTTDDAGFRIGNYGDVDSVEDDSEHEFVVYCVDKHTGEIVWQRTSHVGVPRVKRHLKSSHANPTVACNGQFVICSFGSEGLYCYDMQGNLVWSRDFGVLDSGWFYDASYQWGFGSSPIIHDDKVLVQCDIQEDSFIAALELSSGQDVWRTPRDEIPTWATPTVCATPSGPIVVTNGTNAIRAYELETGQIRWWRGGNSEIAVPTPFQAHDLIFVSSGYRPIQPIVAIELDAEGSLDPVANSSANEASEGDGASGETAEPRVAWHRSRGGPYMPSPIVYGAYLYTCQNNGIVACYDAQTGDEVYRSRLSVDGAQSFVASPVASDGMVYLTSEQGVVVVLRAGPKFEVVSSNRIGESCLATPAISEGVMYFRGEKRLIAIARNRPPRP